MANGIKGFSGLRFFEVTQNNTTGYTTGTKVDIPGVVSATCERKTEEFTLYADDGIYDSGAEFSGETWEIVVQELSLNLMSQLDGATYDEQSSTYSWGTDSSAPEIAFAFKALKRDGNYRMIKYYSARVTSIKTEYKTLGENKDGSRYTISLSAGTRVLDNKMFTAKDSANAADLTWLDTMVEPAESRIK